MGLDKLAGPVIGIGTSLLGGFLGSSAAKKAAEAQKQAAYTSADKAISTASDVTKGIGQAETAGNALVSNATGAGQAAVIDAGGRATNGVLDATQRGVDRLTPYSDVGQQAFTTLGGMLAPGGALMKDFTADDMAKYDPGYQFRLDQAAKALQRSQTAKGGALGGGAAKAMQDYIQNTASSEFGNAFNRFDTNRKFQFGALSDVAKTGLQAGEAAGQLDLSGHQIAGNFDLGSNTTAANLGMQGAEFQANNAMHSADSQGGFAMRGAEDWGNDVMGAGNARAAGYMGAANAWSGALNGVAEAGYQMFAPQPSNGGGGGGGFMPYASATPFNPNAGFGGMPTYSTVPASAMGPQPTMATLANLGVV